MITPRTVRTAVTISFDDIIVGLVQQAMSRPPDILLNGSPTSFGNLEDHALCLSMPRGTGNTEAAMIILRRFDDSFLIVATEHHRRYVLEREAPSVRDPMWAEQSSHLGERITTLGAITAENGPFMRGVSFAKLRGKRGQIIVTDGVRLPSGIMSQMFYKWNVALLVNIGK